ncbi:hypothetical protein NECAME_01352 [Necator americanus]|uniref:Uncharacterized protein n=1 Tax=Necator americanus TaxID=51031 RepID=W2TX20_NECAM|nr:hypothetical protein NECAME_01352 [Necator americanus]ETN86224.1 hypothetical protein NECAME_01352 [Necator americanus]
MRSAKRRGGRPCRMSNTTTQTPMLLIYDLPRATLLPRNGQPASPQDPKDLPFLDPNRKQETQTREELIY